MTANAAVEDEVVKSPSYREGMLPPGMSASRRRAVGRVGTFGWPGIVLRHQAGTDIVGSVAEEPLQELYRADVTVLLVTCQGLCG